MQQQINNVHLEGPIYSCILDETEKKLIANISLVTATRYKKGNESAYKDKMIHHVRIVTEKNGQNAQKLREITDDCKANKELFKTTDSLPKINLIAIDGQIVTNDNKENFILADEQSISFPTKIKTKNNMMSLQGAVLETTANKSYASAILLSKSDYGKVIIPMIVFDGDNSKGWARINANKLPKGELIKVSGPLVSQTFNNGKESIYRISVKGMKYESINKQNTKKKVQVSI